MPGPNQEINPTWENTKEIFELMQALLYSKGMTIAELQAAQDLVSFNQNEIQKQIDTGIKVRAIIESSPGVYDLTPRAARMLVDGVS